MNEVINFLLRTNLHLWLLLMVAIGLSIYSILARASKKKHIDINILIFVIFISAAISFGAELILSRTENRENLDLFIVKLEKYANCDYAQDKLGDLKRDLLKFQTKKVETFYSEQTISELVRSLSNAKYQAIFVDHYILAWDESLELFYNTNLSALDRRVEIKRIFILSENIFSSPVKMRSAINVMSRQFNDGIDVRYIRQIDLIHSDINYKLYALNNIALFDNELLCKISPEANKMPSHALIYWSYDDVQENNRIPNLLTSRYLNIFNNETIDELLDSADSQS